MLQRIYTKNYLKFVVNKIAYCLIASNPETLLKKWEVDESSIFTLLFKS